MIKEKDTKDMYKEFCNFKEKYNDLKSKYENLGIFENFITYSHILFFTVDKMPKRNKIKEVNYQKLLNGRKSNSENNDIIKMRFHANK